MPVRPQTVAFDVVGTLISLEPLRRRFVEIGLSGSVLERWFALTLRDGMALTPAGDREAFPTVGRPRCGSSAAADRAATGWAARHETHHGDVFTRADVIGTDLADVAEGLPARPTR